MSNKDLILYLAIKAVKHAVAQDDHEAATTGAMLCQAYLRWPDKEIDALVADIRREMPEILPS